MDYGDGFLILRNMGNTIHSVMLEMEKKKENNEVMNKSETPQIKEVRVSGVKFRKSCELRVISDEACDDRVKF
jgi:hypothetical protein